MNKITEGRGKLSRPDPDGVIERQPTSAMDDLKAEILGASTLKAAGNNVESRARSSVESRKDLREAVVNELSESGIKSVEAIQMEKTMAQNWADLDASDFGRLRSPVRKEIALESIAANIRLSPEYTQEIKQRSPILADAAVHLNEERQKLQDQAAHEAAELRRKNETQARSTSRMAVLDAAAMALLQNVRRDQSLAVSLALSRQEDSISSLGAAVPKLVLGTRGDVSEIAESEAIERRAENLMTLPRNGLTTDKARDDVQADLASIRKISNATDRHFAAVVMGDIAENQSKYKAELKRQDPAISKEVGSAVIENAKRAAAKEDLKAEDAKALTGAGRPLKRPLIEMEVSEAMRKRFIVTTEKTGIFDNGRSEFSFRNGENQGRVAFVDAGKNISTERQDKETVRSMIEVSLAKGWKEITVSGSEEFRRTAWLEARLNNLEVKGYEPRAIDKAILADLVQDKAPTNKIELSDRTVQLQTPTVSHGKRGSERHIDGDSLSPAERTVIANARELTKEHGPKFSEAVARELETRLRGERIFIGELVKHGEARYQFDEKNDPSYFVTLKTIEGEKTIWGKHLSSAMEQAAMRNGDSVVLRNTGQKGVEISERMYDDAGKLTGTRPKSVNLNEWTAEPLSRFSMMEKKKMESKSLQGSPQLSRSIAPQHDRASAMSNPVQQQNSRTGDRPPPNRDR
ncbi:MAG: LPD7 domain-containing protein [Burkholderiaceae bacterium]|nr:LPD7 domain-containing protein [Burkholderiaceae bacterium]